MRIVHYYPPALFGTGGAAQSVRGWAEGMSSAGADVVVATDGGRYGSPDGLFEWADVSFRVPVRLGRPEGLEDLLGPADLLVLHSGWTLYNVWAAQIAVRIGTPYVITPHGSYASAVLARKALKRRVWFMIAERLFLQRAVAVHLFFDDEHPAVRQLGYQGPLITAPNGVTVPPDVSWDGGSGGYFLWMGRFDVTCKGLDLLVGAAERATGSLKIRLHGPESRGKDEARRLIEERDLSDVVTVGEMLTGPDKWRTLARAQGFVFPSRWDAHSIAVMEAAAVGVPLIVSATTAVGRMLSTHQACRLVPLDPDALAAAMTSVRGDDEGLSRRGRDLIRRDFRWPVVGGSFIRQVEPLL